MGIGVQFGEGGVPSAKADHVGVGVGEGGGSGVIGIPERREGVAVGVGESSAQMGVGVGSGESKTLPVGVTVAVGVGEASGESNVRPVGVGERVRIAEIVSVGVFVCGTICVAIGPGVLTRHDNRAKEQTTALSQVSKTERTFILVPLDIHDRDTVL